MNYVRRFLMITTALVATQAVQAKPVAISTDEDFQKELSKDRVVIKCYANWCPACRKFAPTFDKVSNNPIFNDRVSFVAINYDNIDAIPTFKALAKIHTIPTLIYLTKGTVVEIDVDASSRQEKELTTEIKRILDIE